MVRSTLIRNIASILWSAWRRRYLIAIPILLMPFVGLGVGVLAPKTYETYTTILFQEASTHNPFLEDLSVATNLKARMEALNALLHSRHILAGVAWQMKLLDVEMDDKEKAAVIADLSQSLNARLVGDDLIKITFRSPVSENMAETLKLVSMRFVERVLAPQRSSIQQSETFLARELDLRRQDLEVAEGKLAEYQSQFASELPELHSGNVSRLSTLQALIAQRRIELEGARGARLSLASRLSQTNPVVGKIEEAIVGVMADLTELRGRYTDQHSRVQSVLAKLRALEHERKRLLSHAQHIDPNNLNREVLERLWAIATNTSQDTNGNNFQPLLVSQLERLQKADDKVHGLQEEIASLEKEIELLAKRVNGFGQHKRRLNELTRDIQVRQKIYQDLADRHELARVTGSLGKEEESERVKLIDPPFDPVAPVNLPLLIFVIAGGFAGVALGIGLAIVAELLDTTIRRKEIVTRILEVPVLTRIPPFEKSQQSGGER